jgi:hypothetical protein
MTGLRIVISSVVRLGTGPLGRSTSTALSVNVTYHQPGCRDLNSGPLRIRRFSRCFRIALLVWAAGVVWALLPGVCARFPLEFPPVHSSET